MQYEDPETISALVAAINTDYPDEQCGIITRRTERIQLSGGPAMQTSYEMRLVPNRHEDPANHFRIVTGDLDLDDAETLVAVVHTHTRPGEAEPSYDDVKSLPDDLVGIVVHPRTNSWTMYDNKVGVLAFIDGSKK